MPEDIVSVANELKSIIDEAADLQLGVRWNPVPSSSPDAERIDKVLGLIIRLARTVEYARIEEQCADVSVPHVGVFAPTSTGKTRERLLSLPPDTES